MRIILLGLLLSFFCGCKDGEKNDKDLDIIDINIFKAIEEFEKECEQQEGRQYPIAIYFTDSIPSSLFFNSHDSIMIMSFYDARADFPIQYRKGTLKVDSLPIVIYDKDNIGMDYYDSTKLTQEEVNATNMELIMMSVFIMKQDGLHRWHPPL